MKKLRYLVALVGLSLCIFSAVSMSVGPALADTISGEATVSNVSPEVIGENSTQSWTVDPESSFDIRVQVRDNDTLADVENVRLEVYNDQGGIGDPDESTSEVNHYTFWFDPSDNTWHCPMTDSDGTTVYIDGGASSYPSDLSVDKDNYVFNITLDTEASPVDDNWACWAEVDDGTAKDNSEFCHSGTVNSRKVITVEESSIEWSGLEQGTTENPSDNNPIGVIVDSNGGFNVQSKVDDWSGPTTIPAENTTMENDADLDAATEFGKVSMSTTYDNVYEGAQHDENVHTPINYYLDIPSDAPGGTYTTTFYIDVAWMSL